MFIQPAKNDHGLPYNPIKACAVPRPIGWITTVNKVGDINVAPFCMFSAGGHAENHEDKDTVANIKKTGEFVYNMATWNQREQMNQTGLTIDRELDELAQTRLEGIPSKMVAPAHQGLPGKVRMQIAQNRRAAEC